MSDHSKQVKPARQASPRLDGGEAVVEAFRKLGVDYIMSSPGSEWCPVWESIARQKFSNRPGPGFIETWHELTAVDMALGYTQYSGKISGVLLHAGVGLMAGAMGIHAARNFEIPLLIMSGESETFGEDPAAGIGPQWHDHLGLIGGTQRIVEPLTKWAVHVGSIHTFFQQMVRAGEIAQRTPKGPVYLAVPVEEVLKTWTPVLEERQVPPAPKLRPPQSEIERVASALMAAKRPLILTDAAGRDPQAFHALGKLAEAFAVPVMDGRVVSYANISRNHPCYVGGHDEAAVQQSDLILLVEARAVWYPTGKRPANATIVAISENHLKMQYPHQNLDADSYLEGDVASTLELLVEARQSAGKGEGTEQRRKDIEVRHDKWVAGLHGAEDAAEGKTPLLQLALCAALRKLMPEDTIYLDETIFHSGMFKKHLWWNEPQSYFVVGGGLGQGSGVALGVKLAAPTRPVVLLIGDGSFLYNPMMQALGASQQHQLPILIIICNNHRYKAMEHDHRRLYPDGVAIQNDIWHGVKIDGPSYSEFGAPFGFFGRKIDKVEQLADGLRDALKSVQSGVTAILDISVDG